ncbi:DUF4998 domain-containing protein [uncultured Proteiniphilum sp.]|uniref:DUF4998 domain-containing protein n=1 Tax=uncultured Proteiniphilum sp. TaxID=497637 RepID=UPI0026149F7A|nr:DUF4998 domain-containing protein [uncultured Proteiniphilum sp.]
MDKTYAEFLESGPIIYNAKLDSIKTYPGRNRILVTWKPITDPRVTKVKVFWSDNKESLEMPVTSSQDTTLLIEGLSEGNYTLNFHTYDNAGNHSMKVEVLGRALGEAYEQRLSLRNINSIGLENSVATIKLRSMEGVEEYIYEEITYTSSTDQEEKIITLPGDISEVVIADYTGEEFTHRSVYRPSEFSPDLFYSATQTEYTPSNPLQVYPEDGMTGVSCAPEFRWHNSVLLPDGAYRVEYSTDQSNWTSVPAVNKGILIPKNILNPHTHYYWRVSATKGGETRQSTIRHFTTGEKTLYADGEAVRVQSHTTGLNPVRIAFTGDGFQQIDHNYNGLFDRYIEEAVEAFFSVEPYKSYREYFEVWKVAAYSDDYGISESDRSIRLNTVFESNFNGNTITCKPENVYQYVKNIPGVDDAALSDMATVVILNKKRVGGASHVTNDRRSIALVPVYKNSASGLYTDFTDVVIRQGGGFSFGLLADETSTATGTLSASEENQLRAAWEEGRLLNVDLTSDPNQVRWAHFIGRSGYIRPNIYEGAYGYKSGIYRSEETSSMVNGINYFNAISRELIVKRIMSIAGEPYSFDKFLEKDVARTPYQ